MKMRNQFNVFISFVLFLVVHSMNAQEKTVNGVIADAQGQPVPGVNILEKGTTNSGSTDFDGKFTMKVQDSKSILIFSFVGFKTKEVPAGQGASLKIVLVEAGTALDEVVVVGYGTQKKKDLTGAVGSANLKQFEDSPNTSILQSLQGSLPGVTIGQTATAGTDQTIVVRGRNTLGGNTGVLIILDGAVYRGAFTDLNPADIQSVDVLKDPSSKAIYGAQAANGIIMVTSKKGKKSQKTEVNYSTFYSIQSPIINRRTLNREEFIESSRVNQYTKGFLAPDYVTPNPNYNYLTDSGIAANLDIQNSINNGTDFNWFEAGQNNSPYIVDHQLSVRGGSEKTTFFLSAGYTDQLGWIVNDNYKRNSVRVNIDTQVNDWLKVGVNTFGAFSDRSGVSPNLQQFVLMSPLNTPFNTDGTLRQNPAGNNLENPFLSVLSDDLDKQSNIGAQAYASIDVPGIKGLNYRINYNNNYRWNQRFNSNPNGANKQGTAYKNNASTYDTALDNILSYNTHLDERHLHGLNATLVYGWNRIENEFTNASASQFSNQTLGYNNLGVGLIPKVGSGGYEESFLSTTARIIYDYDGKYLFNASIRRDGHSAFAEGNKIGYFPAVSAGWVLSKEGFLSKYSQINLLKLRASYGLNGNTSPRYSSQSTYSSSTDSQYVFGDNAQTVNSFTLNGLISPDLTWEKTEGYNVGLDFAFLNNRISGSADYYLSTTRDMLFDRALSATAGVNSVRVNIGELQNTGFEFNLSFNPVRSKDWNWDLGLNFSHNDNKITGLTGEDLDNNGKEDDLVQNNYFIGKSIGVVYTYVQDGIYQLGDAIPAGSEPGSYKFKDLDGNGVIDVKDRTFIGKAEADYQFGISNNLTYKNFSLKFFISSIQGGIAANDPWSNGGGYYGLTTYVANNHFSDIDAWAPNNPNAEYSRANSISPITDFSPYKDRSFVRLQDISFAYTMDKELVKKAGLSNVKIYVSGKNLATWTKWKGWDPETVSGLGISPKVPGTQNDVYPALPVMKSVNLGLDLTF
ncbi:TonB-dependent receptor [Flavobacterium cupreum]|uniref:TonB-dependent receptor n=2 Tax=Flavobacterium TaxID=237 RepID=A0A4Y7UET0_9FLAO|nr:MULTISPECIES: TonB-dependent receptor [Flavobacterium]RUT67981.1 TonB-dependent receptor [Flavobacterium cupreum]TCN59007.1 TonB-linked SusC/RagA family outer membrane protein [Flavobacterium circumlabens]TEB44408.1 TonB-dependent receptor [Flavobacterium circumlabens]